jgi:nucleotide-binding universal stress UspA family protein
MTTSKNEEYKMKKNHINILIPVDFTETGEQGLKTASLISKKISGTIHLFHIINPPTAAGITEDADMLAKQQRMAENELFLVELVKKREKDLDQLAKRYDFGEMELMATVGIGDYDRQIEKFVKDHAVDLVIMGTEGENSITELFSGSHAERTIRDTDLPVLAIKRYNPSMRFNTLLMALDIRDHDERAVYRIVRFAKKLGMEFILVHVKKKKDVIEENIEDLLTRFAEKYALSHYTIEVAADGKVSQKLEELSEKYQADIIATFSESEKGLIRLFFGSKTRDLLKESDIPLLSIHDK